MKAATNAWRGAVVAAGIVVTTAAFAAGAGASGPSHDANARKSCAHQNSPIRSLSKKQRRTAMLCLINKARKDKNRNPLTASSALRHTAHAHNKRMHSQGCQAHVCAGEESVAQRIAKAFCDGRCDHTAENIARGNGRSISAKRIFDNWMDSPGHRKNILDGKSSFVGIDVLLFNSKRGQLWTTDFATPLDKRRGTSTRCVGTDKPTKKLSAREAVSAMLCMINLQRERHGVEALSASDALASAAAGHNRTMFSKHCQAHVCPGEPSVNSRLQSTNFCGGRCHHTAENIARGNGASITPFRIFDNWLHSAGHRKNMLDPKSTDIGIAFLVYNRNSSQIWTTDFASR